jgi:hypothetical protein
MERIDAVRRSEHASTRPDDAAQLAHGGAGIGHVLEHLQAQDDVEARVVDRYRFERAVQVCVRVPRHVEAERVREELPVRTVAAADVEHACIGLPPAQPLEERLAHGVLHGAARRVEASAHSRAANPNPRNVSASSGIPATYPCAAHNHTSTQMSSRG